MVADAQAKLCQSVHYLLGGGLEADLTWTNGGGFVAGFHVHELKFIEWVENLF